VKPSTQKRLIKRYAQEYLRESGLTREQIETRVAEVIRRRPRYCPRWVWSILLRLVVNPKQLELVRMHQPAADRRGVVKP
jgi:hypothetical protein